jgi:hypothetical protein
MRTTSSVSANPTNCACPQDYTWLLVATCLDGPGKTATRESAQHVICEVPFDASLKDIKGMALEAAQYEACSLKDASFVVQIRTQFQFVGRYFYAR